MKKVIVYIAMSLDGFVADSSGSVEWLGGDGSDVNNLGSYEEFYKTIDTVILGRVTYDQIVNELSPNDWPYKGKKTYVLTHSKLPNSNEIIFTDNNLNELVVQIKSENKTNIWVCGGANVVSQMIDLNLVDKICVSVIPKLIGDGIKLFNLKNKKQLKLVSSNNYNGITDLMYEVVK